MANTQFEITVSMFLRIIMERFLCITEKELHKGYSVVFVVLPDQFWKN